MYTARKSRDTIAHHVRRSQTYNTCNVQSISISSQPAMSCKTPTERGYLWTTGRARLPSKPQSNLEFAMNSNSTHSAPVPATHRHRSRKQARGF
ncbi:hypothetical protein BDV10DRAFT_164673 [Aspergillus recurvatus]